MKIFRMIPLFIFITLLSSASGKTYEMTYAGPIKGGAWLRDQKIEYDFEGVKDSGVVQIYFPAKYKKGDNLRTLIALHGYAGYMRDWELNSGIQALADKYDFIVVCPNMGRTLYETSYYPETEVRWGRIPGGRFIGEILVSHMRKTFGIARDRESTGVFGLSTGARGALLVSGKYVDVFGAAAGLSGDYSHLSMTSDNLLISMYGRYDLFEQRWKNDDNIMELAVNLKNTPVFLSHGESDSIVPKEQSMVFAIKLKQLQKKHGGYEIEYKPGKNKGHDWKYWGSMLPDIMEFFDKKLKR